MRILYFVTNFPYYSETFVAEEIKQFCNAGHEVVVCNFTWYKPEQEDFTQRIINNTKSPVAMARATLTNLRAGKSLFFSRKTWSFIFSSIFHRPSFTAKYLFMLFSLDYMLLQVRDVPFDIAISHFLFKSTLAAHLICANVEKPYHIRLHTKRGLYTKKVLKKVLNGASGITAESKDVGSFYESYLSSAYDIKVIRQSIDLERLKELDVEPAHQPKVKLIAIGRLVPKKGFDVLIKALAKFNTASRAAVSLDIYGSGPLLVSLRKQIEDEGLQDTVAIHGMLAHRPLMSKLAAADLLVVPSVELKKDIDGVPTVIAEAMAVRTPVLATPIAGIGEMVEDGVTGFLIAPKDSQSLKDKLASLVTNRELRTSVIPAAVNKVSEEYRMTLVQELGNLQV